MCLKNLYSRTILHVLFIVPDHGITWNLFLGINVDISFVLKGPKPRKEQFLFVKTKNSKSSIEVEHWLTPTSKFPFKHEKLFSE
jgi:hypothetical protein